MSILESFFKNPLLGAIRSFGFPKVDDDVLTAYTNKKPEDISKTPIDLRIDFWCPGTKVWYWQESHLSCFNTFEHGTFLRKVDNSQIESLQVTQDTFPLGGL